MYQEVPYCIFSLLDKGREQGSLASSVQLRIIRYGNWIQRSFGGNEDGFITLDNISK